MNKKDVGIISQLYWKLLPSQIFCAMVGCLSTIINGLIVGNSLDSNSIAALGLMGIMSTLLATASSLISGGARIVCGRYIGRGEFDKVSTAFSVSVLMLVVFGVGITFAYVFISVPIATLLGATGSIVETTAMYIRANALGIMALLVSPCLMSFLDMNNQTKYSLTCACILALCNLTFGLINIKVLNGGLFGMGISSSISQIVCLVCLALRFVKDKSLPRINFKNAKFESYKEILILGLPSALIGLYQIRNIFLNRFAGSVAGEAGLTALSILNSCGGIFDSVATGIGATTLMISSVLYGEGDRKSIKKFFKFAVYTALMINVVKGIVFIILSKPIATIFGARGEILALTMGLLINYGITMPLNATPNVCINYYAATGKSKLANFLYPFTCFIFPIGYIWLTIPILKINAVWTSYAAAEILITLTIIIISIIKNKHLPKRLYDISMLSDDFGTKKENNITITVTSVDEVVNVARTVEEFAKGKGADSKRAYMIGLCLEEMASNIVLHGFAKGKANKKYYIDIYVRYENDKFYTRLRDNAPEFNPQKRLERDKEDPTKNFGIQMVNKLATNMYYQTTFGMNVLTIEL